jgi:S-adenosylmethionine synthetase
MSHRDFLFTSESVSEGHPDKVCDLVSDAILDAHLAQDRFARVACETLCKDGWVVLAGEITSKATVDAEAVVREVVAEIGYTDPERAFAAQKLTVVNRLGQQAGDIAQGVGQGLPIGAGDQGLMFGYATAETPELIPLPIALAHRITSALARFRKSGQTSWLRPDAKAQVTVRYVSREPREVTAIVVSTQHAPGVPCRQVEDWVRGELLPAALGQWHNPLALLHVNPTGDFSIGGPEGDCGLTGRKIIVDTYGGFARHGGGAFSGKDPSKVDRSAAYFARWVARQVVEARLALRCELQVAYAIGVAEPVSVSVDTFGTGDAAAAEEFALQFDYRPARMIELLDLLRPIYRQTTNYGHFGRSGLPWEETAASVTQQVSKGGDLK